MVTLINHQGIKKVSGLQLQSPAPPLGLAYIGAFLKKNGHDYTAIDACGEGIEQLSIHGDLPDLIIQGLSVKQVVDKIPNNTVLIGFSCLFSHCYPLVKEMLVAVRQKFPEMLIVIGGESPTAMPYQALQDGFNIVVMGEGEETFLELIESVKKQKPWKLINGIAYLDNEQQFVKNPPRRRMTAIDDLPYPDWDAWCLESYIEHQQISGLNLGRTMPILGSRGCPYACTFCSNEGMWTRRYIMRDPESLIDEIAFFKEKYNISSFVFFDSTFIINRKKTLAFAQSLKRRALNITYQLPAGTRCEAFDQELADALAESGLKNFAFAPESGSPYILAAIKKQIDLDKFYQAVKIVLQTPMTIGCFIVIGFPEDSTDSLKSTLQLVRKLAFMGVHDVTVSQFTPYPGSPYFEQLQAQGKITQDLLELASIVDFFSSSNQSYCETLSSKQLHRWMLWIYINFYIISFLVRPWRPIKNLWSYIFHDGAENTRYMRLLKELLVNRKKWKKRLKS